jgi:hypothetical protein
VRASGKGGELKYHYQIAAIVDTWTLEPMVGTNGHRFRLSADLLSIIEPWCGYRPLELYLTMNGSKWLWNELDPKRISLPTLDMELHEPPTIIKENTYA